MRLSNGDQAQNAKKLAFKSHLHIIIGSVYACQHDFFDNFAHFSFNNCLYAVNIVHNKFNLFSFDNHVVCIACMRIRLVNIEHG